MLQAAKSLGRGLRELGETVASSLTGNSHNKPGSSVGVSHGNSPSELLQKGIITVLDIEVRFRTIYANALKKNTNSRTKLSTRPRRSTNRTQSYRTSWRTRMQSCTWPSTPAECCFWPLTSEATTSTCSESIRIPPGRRSRRFTTCTFCTGGTLRPGSKTCVFPQTVAGWRFRLLGERHMCFLLLLTGEMWVSGRTLRRTWWTACRGSIDRRAWLRKGAQTVRFLSSKCRLIRTSRITTPGCLRSLILLLWALWRRSGSLFTFRTTTAVNNGNCQVNFALTVYFEFAQCVCHMLRIWFYWKENNY